MTKIQYANGAKLRTNRCCGHLKLLEPSGSMALPTTTSVNMERKFVPKSGRHPSVRLRYSLLTANVFNQLGNIRAIVEHCPTAGDCY